MPKTVFDYILHLDTYLTVLIQNYGIFIYPILFFVIFVETGFVLLPFLPGDSLLFIAGTFAAAGALNVYLIFFLLVMAAVLGDTVNYWIGHTIGPRAFTGKVRFIGVSNFSVPELARARKAMRKHESISWLVRIAGRILSHDAKF